MKLHIVGVGPGDPGLLTLGSLQMLRSAGRAVTVLAPPELSQFFEREGVQIVRGMIGDQALFVRGSSEEVQAFVERLDDEVIALAVLGNPLSDFPGLPILLRALEQRKIGCQIVPGMPRATLSAAIAMPLVPLPPASAHHSWDDLVEIMARLRRSCPWDREQTHRSLVPYLIEEAYEVADAIENENETELCEELGDLLLQIVFHAQLATERGRFSVADVIDALANKMIRRHPHVFGDQAVADVAEVWQNWEQLKSQEAAGKARRSRLDGIPKGLGALQRGQKMQEKAARVGFDWPDIGGVLDKVSEELRELALARAESPEARVRDEFGDLLFSLVNYARSLGLEAEGAMRQANDKFYKRFTFMEAHAARTNRSLADMSLDELEELWELAKLEAA